MKCGGAPCRNLKPERGGPSNTYWPGSFLYEGGKVLQAPWHRHVDSRCSSFYHSQYGFQVLIYLSFSVWILGAYLFIILSMDSRTYSRCELKLSGWILGSKWNSTFKIEKPNDTTLWESPGVVLKKVLAPKRKNPRTVMLIHFSHYMLL